VTRCLIVLLAAAAAFAQAPATFENARIETRAAGADLESTMRTLIAGQTAAPAWIGYSVPIVPGERHVCGWDNSGDTRSLQQTRMSLEGPSALYVLYRAEAGKLSKVRIATPDCQIDVGGLRLTWLTGVAVDQSVRYLQTLTEGRGDQVVSAIAMHNTPAADQVLDALTAQDKPVELRRKAVFWLGVARGRHGYDRLLNIVRSDPNEKVREHAIFALSQSKEPDAIPTIIKIAHDDTNAHVRGQALFWLAQKAGSKVAGDAIANAIASDPDTEVKRRAVFALSRLPNGEGVPKLIDVAKTNRNAEVRKQAMFWLGQSKDPRALDFIEQVLTR
jgi:hypothetical protein